MDHIQTQILDRAVSLLTGLLTTGIRVYKSVEHPITPDSMPGICVSISGESMISGLIDSTIKSAELVILVVVPGDDAALSARVQAECASALYADCDSGRYFNRLALGIVFKGMDRQFVTKTAIRHTKTVLSYGVEYGSADGNDYESI